MNRISWPFYLILLPLFFVFHGYEENYALVPAGSALWILAIYLLGTIAISALLWVYFRNWSKAFFMTFFLVAYYFFFGSIHDFLKSHFENSFITRYTWLLGISFLLFIAGSILLKRSGKNFSKAFTYLNILLALFIVVDLVQFGIKLYSPGVKAESLAVKSCDSTNVPHPDIYLIVADEYAGQKELLDLFNFDNKVFHDSLMARGLFVAKESSSNYNYTLYSMASILNMEYLSLSQERIDKASPPFAYQEIFNSKVISYFKGLGYRFYNHTYFDFKGNFTESANSFVPSRTTLITSQTLSSRIEKELWHPTVSRLHWDWALKKKKYENMHYNNELIASTSRISSDRNLQPKFVYTHLEMPHYPYYYNSDGGEYPFEVLDTVTISNKEHYLGYLQYANKVLLNLVDTIMKNSVHPPVIILMSDHGYRRLTPKKDPALRFSNLFSIYLPNGNYAKVADTMSAVNVFRTVLNNQFCQDLPMLPHRSISIEF